MPVYLAPGVYVEEVPSVPPIVGVGTSTAAFIGVVNEFLSPPTGPFKMPLNPVPQLDPLYNIPVLAPFKLADLNTPVLVTNFEQFKRNFGDFQFGNQTLAHAV